MIIAKTEQCYAEWRIFYVENGNEDTLSKAQPTEDYLLGQESRAGSITLRQCASQAGVGQPTVLRMLEACGFEGWSAFQRAICFFRKYG